MDKWQALQSFWSRFGKTYDESTVEDNPTFPYITYEAAGDSIGSQTILRASVWDRSRSWKTVTDITEEISKTITMGGITIPFESGIIWIKRSTPFAQRLTDEDDSIRRININVEVEFISAD
jgi:hypothetical protein